MAISVQDLDQLLGYDPATHSVAGIPAMKSAQPASPSTPAGGVMSPVQRNNMDVDMAKSSHMAAQPTIPKATAMPSAAAAPEIPAASSAAVEGASIPALVRPAWQQSVALGTSQHGTTAREEGRQQLADIASQRGTSVKQEGKREFEQDMPQITAAPFTPEYYQQQRALSDYKQAHPLGGDISAKPGFWGKLEHGLATAGNIAGDVVAPGTMALIPGTDLNNRAQRAGQMKGFNSATEDQEKQATTQNLESETAQRDAAAGQWKPMGEPKQDPTTGQWFQSGTGKDASGQEVTSWKPLSGGPTATPGKTPAEQTYDKLLTQTNPATGQPYTAQEALAEVTKAPPTSEAADDARYEKITADSKLGKTVSPEDQAWASAYTQRKSIGPQATAAAGAQNATLTPLINPTTGEMMGTFNTKTGEMKPLAKSAPGGATTAAGAGVGNKQIEAFNKDYVNPAESIERSYQMFQDAYKAIQSGDAKTGAEDMLLLSQHLGTTFGQVKGSRMNKDLIQEHKDAVNWLDRAQILAQNAAANGYQVLTPDQRKEFSDLISNMRNLTWQTAAKEAARSKQPINFLPPDVQIKMRDSKGTERPVPGNRVQEYLDKGAELGE